MTKPKLSSKRKLERLLKNNPVPSTFIVSFMHAYNRFNEGKTAGNKLETIMFNKFRGMPFESREIMQRTTKSFSSLSAKHKGAFANKLMKNIHKPIDADALGKAFVQELKGIVKGLALGPLATKEPDLKERPGKVRLHEYGPDDVYPNQVHIFKINDLRTNDHVPFLKKQDYLPAEFQQVCMPIDDGDEIKLDCKMKKPPCDGYPIGDVCLRVQEIQSGTSVTITGVNFFDINSKIWIRRKGSSSNFKKLKAFVYGDILTPVKRTVNGKRRLIADSRVKDKIFFSIPINTTPGIYEFKVAVPNSSGFSGRGFGDILFSNIQYIEIIAPSTARFQIASERLWARDETGSYDFTGSDEVGIKINAIPFFADLRMGTMQQQSFRFGDVDSGETRPMESVLFSHSKPIAGVILSVIGYEIDSEDAYQKEITKWTDIFVELLKDELSFLMSNSKETKDVLKWLFEQGFWGYVAIGFAILLTAAINLLISLWAGPDIIILDTLALTVSDLGRMTSMSFPIPKADSNKTIYTTADNDIQVRLMLNGKITNEYIEERGYLSSEQKSWYNIKFRYSRLA